MKTQNAKVMFTFDDVSELYHIICKRGFCSTRAKLVNALRELDPALASRVDEMDALSFDEGAECEIAALELG